MYNNQYNPFMFNTQTYQNTQPYQNTQNYAQQNYQQVQPIQQNTNDRQIQGRPIENLEMAKTIETPLNGSTLYLPLLDKSAIVTKRLTVNGTSEITIFKPISEEKDETKPITLEDIKTSLDELKNRNNDDIISAIEDFKKELKKKSDK